MDGSTLALDGHWSFVGNAAGELHGKLGGLPVEMVWEGVVEPGHGDCVTKPASQFRVIAQGTVG
jgi:hypothetical protein